MKVRILATGGTFDKEYDELTGKLFFKDTHLPEMLKLGRSRIEAQVETLMMIDSLEMTDEGRAKILDRCRSAPESHVVITHGTDTMEQTARLLAKEVTGKTIVLTGAMIPYKFGSSDGLFNLGAAIAFAQALPAGVYVAMNGQIFEGDNVTKNRETGEFRKLR